MPKLLGLLVLPLLLIGSSGRQVDPIAAEIAELDAQVEAMKRHPSLLERSIVAPAEVRTSAQKADVS